MSPVQAGRPLQTEDAGVLDRRDCEVELVGSRLHEPDAPSVRGATAQLGCGIGFASQVALLGGQARSDGERTEALALVGKTALRPLTDEQAGIVIAWALGADRPAGGSLRHETTEIRLVATQPIGPWLLHANLGATRSERERLDRTLFSAAVERTGLGPVDAMAEVFGDDRSDAWLNGALRWSVNDGHRRAWRQVAPIG
ncbi:MAG: hypothetical protein U5L03_01640 [Burkholderiaceae bacterium]|nr:hypothetical protein [Burkholderiaceae bacterium]